MKAIFIGLLAIIVFTFSSCSKAPEWADPEAHEKTEQLQKQYTSFIVGTWHIERVTEINHYFERLTFQADGKLSGMRKWQRRELVTIDGEQRYTDWENVEPLNGFFSGTWRLKWERDDKGVGHDRIYLDAKFEDANYEYVAYSCNALFNLVNNNILRISGLYSNIEGWTEYQKGDAEPSF
jgi:hypothetical protein